MVVESEEGDEGNGSFAGAQSKLNEDFYQSFDQLSNGPRSPWEFARSACLSKMAANLAKLAYRVLPHVLWPKTPAECVFLEQEVQGKVRF